MASTLPRRRDRIGDDIQSEATKALRDRRLMDFEEAFVEARAVLERSFLEAPVAVEARQFARVLDALRSAARAAMLDPDFNRTAIRDIKVSLNRMDAEAQAIARILPSDQLNGAIFDLERYRVETRHVDDVCGGNTSPREARANAVERAAILALAGNPIEDLALRLRNVAMSLGPAFSLVPKASFRLNPLVPKASFEANDAEAMEAVLAELRRDIDLGYLALDARGAVSAGRAARYELGLQILMSAVRALYGAKAAQRLNEADRKKLAREKKMRRIRKPTSRT